MTTLALNIALLLALHRAAASTCKQSDQFNNVVEEHQLLQRRAFIGRSKSTGTASKDTSKASEAQTELHSEREQHHNSSETVHRGKMNFTTSTSYCYEKSTSDCWASKPGASTPLCTASSGNTQCRCPSSTGVACDMDELHRQPAVTGRCQEKVVYVSQGRRLTNSAGEVDVRGSGQEVYCRLMVKNDQWEQKHIVKLPSDPPAESNSSWLSCWSPNTWKDHKCQRKQRYLGETCWGSVSGAGHCAGSDTEYDEYSTSCYRGKCVPYAWAEEREECSCAWLGWYFVVACTAAEGKCGGHACIWNAGDGKSYCDYATGQNW